MQFLLIAELSCVCNDTRLDDTTHSDGAQRTQIAQHRMMHQVSRLKSTADHMLLCDIAMRRPLLPALTMCHVANVVVASRQIKGDGACKLDGLTQS